MNFCSYLFHFIFSYLIGNLHMYEFPSYSILRWCVYLLQPDVFVCTRVCFSFHLFRKISTHREKIQYSNLYKHFINWTCRLEIVKRRNKKKKKNGIISRMLYWFFFHSFFSVYLFFFFSVSLQVLCWIYSIFNVCIHRIHYMAVCYCTTALSDGNEKHMKKNMEIFVQIILLFFFCFNFFQNKKLKYFRVFWERMWMIFFREWRLVVV